MPRGEYNQPRSAGKKHLSTASGEPRAKTQEKYSPEKVDEAHYTAALEASRSPLLIQHPTRTYLEGEAEKILVSPTARRDTGLAKP